VPALNRALAFAQRDNASGSVAEELHLDVARALDEALAEHPVVAECRLRLAPRRRQGVLELGLVADDPHAAPAAAGGRLDHEREADFPRVAGR
jgi:hypothetical protein